MQFAIEGRARDSDSDDSLTSGGVFPPLARICSLDALIFFLQSHLLFLCARCVRLCVNFNVMNLSRWRIFRCTFLWPIEVKLDEQWGDPMRPTRDQIQVNAATLTISSLRSK